MSKYNHTSYRKKNKLHAFLLDQSFRSNSEKQYLLYKLIYAVYNCTKVDRHITCGLISVKSDLMGREPSPSIYTRVSILYVQRHSPVD